MAKSSKKSSTPTKRAIGKNASKKASPKKTAPAKKAAAPKKKTPAESSNGFKVFGGKVKPKNGQLVEFISSAPLRGIYNETDDVVYVNGVPYTPLMFKPATQDSLSEEEVRQHTGVLHKMQTLENLDVPRAHRGENLHEQNPELHMDFTRQQIAREEGSGPKAMENTLFGENATDDEEDNE